MLVKHRPLYSIANFMMDKKRDSNVLQGLTFSVKKLILESANKGFGCIKKSLNTANRAYIQKSFSKWNSLGMVYPIFLFIMKHG